MKTYSNSLIYALFILMLIVVLLKIDTPPVRLRGFTFPSIRTQARDNLVTGNEEKNTEKFANEASHLTETQAFKHLVMAENTPTKKQPLNVSELYNDCTTFTDLIRYSKPKMKFVFFFGFNHCGSSATGMVLDAHPNVMVANEFDLFGKMDNSSDLLPLMEQLCSECKARAYKMNTRAVNSKGYSFKMGSNHGLFDDQLQLIGARKSSVTINHFIRNSTEFVLKFHKLASMFSMSGVVVTRNVYDMIATKRITDADAVVEATLSTGETVYVSRYNVSKIGFRGTFYNFCHFGLSNGTVKIVGNDSIHRTIDFMRSIAVASRELTKLLNLHTIVVKLDEMIKEPRPVILKLCQFFGLECFASYIDDVTQGLFSKPNPTRRGVEWTQKHIQAVESLKEDFPEFFFGSYFVDK